MTQNKLQRFEDIKNYPNVFEFPKEKKGIWSEIFNNKNSITLELACGKGEYTLGLAELYNNRNFIGIDIKGNRIWVGAKKALENKITNALFIRTVIDKIEDYFFPNTIFEIWITFPDPYLKKSKLKKRLTHPKFLRLYYNFLNPNGIINLKTDSPDLIKFTLNVIKIYDLNLIELNNDVHNINILNPELKIKTHYENLNISKSNKIFYLKFNLNNNILNKELDIKLIDIEKSI